MKIKSLDSVTLVVKNVARAQRFYHEVLDLPIVKNATETTLQIGKQQLVLITPDETGLHAQSRHAGSTEMMLTTKDPLEQTLAHLTNYAVEIVDGPTNINVANGPATALWLRDPDHNLIKLINY